MCFPLSYKEENNIGRLVIGIMCYTLHNGNLAIFVTYLVIIVVIYLSILY